MDVTPLPNVRADLEELAAEDAEECAELVRDKLDELSNAVSCTVNRFVLRKVEVYAFQSEALKNIYIRELQRLLNKALIAKLKSK